MIDTARVTPIKPWYREPWPWYLMAGPFIVVVAATFTAWLAITSNDGLVTEDYYKKGLAIDQTLARSRLAEELGLELHARFTAEGVEMGLAAMSPQKGYTPPKALMMTLSHPTRAGLDQDVRLNEINGKYVGSIRLPASGHWLILVEDEARTWRIMGNVVLPAMGEVVIGGKPAEVRSSS
jgi:uncharacterized protein